MAYEKLFRLGYGNLRVLDEGIAGWIEHGHPTEGRWTAEPFVPHPYEGAVDAPGAQARR